MSLTLCGTLLLPIVCQSSEHLVPPEAIAGALSRASAQRAQDVRSVEEVLGTAAVRAVSARFGVDVDRLRTGSMLLSDSELRDLATRAGRLRVDVVAGENDPVTGAGGAAKLYVAVMAFLILLAILIVVLVVKAVS